ncbi:MAG: tetratricopeptide repeat protein [Frankiales bacterium]|nr:tetratricopeptide repeat protein [Frankiales bacterium]
MNAEFDFWVGRWQVTDPSDGSTGSNTIRRVLAGKVIEERFHFPGPDGKPYRGRSHTVHVEQRGWCQTWVDSAGLYLDFVGGVNDDGMALERRAVVEGEPVRQRMTWTQIAEDSLVWQWLRTTGDVEDWQLLWRLDYARFA